HDVGRAMRRHHTDLPADAILVEHLATASHRGQVRLAADHDAHEKRSAHAVIPTRCAMSPRRCMPTNVMRATFSYAAERASSSWGARATTQSTRPPDVRTVPSEARRVPA